MEDGGGFGYGTHQENDQWKLRTFRRVRTVLLLIAAILFAAVPAVLVAQKDAIIIRFHFSTWNMLLNLSRVLAGVMVAGVVAMSAKIHGLKKRLGLTRRRKAEEVERATLEVEREEAERRLDTPESVYSYMTRYLDEAQGKPKLAEAVRTVIGQLDRMNDLQGRFEELYQRNNIEALTSARELLQEIEDAICLKHVKGLINRQIAIGDAAFLERVPRVIDANENLLNGAQGVLSDIVDFIESGGDDAGAIAGKIASYRGTIQTFMKEENGNEESAFDGLTLAGGGTQSAGWM